MKKIKIAQIGCGKMASYLVNYATQKGYELVAAFDTDNEKIGKDISYITKGNNLGVKISSSNNLNDMTDVLKKTKPDICIIATTSLLAEIYDLVACCANLGINVITTCEEAFFPFNSQPKLSKKLDNIAKENNCTITGSGYQDVFWNGLIYQIAGATQKIDKIIGSSSYNVEEYGIALARVHGAGFTKEEFEKQIAISDNISEEKRNEMIKEGTFLPSYMWNTCGLIAKKMGLHIISQIQQTIPIIATRDIFSNTLNLQIPKGNCLGMSAKVTAKTKENITIEAECIGKVYDVDEFDKNEWKIEGVPCTSILVDKPNTVELTCATIINRIPNVLEAPSGFIPVCDMSQIKYKL